MSAAYSLPDAARAKDLLGTAIDGLSLEPGPKLDKRGRAASYLGVRGGRRYSDESAVGK